MVQKSGENTHALDGAKVRTVNNRQFNYQAQLVFPPDFSHQPGQFDATSTTLRQSNIAMENGPEMKMYFLLNMWIFQPAMLVYQRVFSQTSFFLRAPPEPL